MNKKLVAIGITLVFLVVGFSGCSELLGPNFEIISKSTREGYDNLDYTLYVDITLYNKGSSGEKTIWAKLTQGDNFWTKKQVVYLENDETTNISFVFQEISFWTPNNSSYDVWID